MQPRKAFIAVSIAGALAALAPAAQALEVKLSGQLSRGVMHVDDGFDAEAFHVDNDNSSTRLRFTGTDQLMPGVRAGVNFEVEYQSAPSNSVSFANRSGPTPTLAERLVELYFEGTYGKLSVGQGDGAANGAVEVDLSGTSIAHYADIAAIGGGILFRAPSGATGPALGAVLSDQDFESRYDRLRYDSPTYNGLRLAASSGVKESRDVFEAALWYGGDLGASGQVAAALGFSKQDALPGGVDDETFGGSLSWLARNGFNLTFGHTRKDVAAGLKGKFTYFKAGYRFGRHAVSADLAMADDQSAAGDDATSFSVGYVFTPIAWAEIFALAKQSELDQAATSYKDVMLLMVGTRLKF